MDDTTEYIYVTIKYSRILGNKDYLPLFISFKGDNTIECKLSKTSISSRKEFNRLLATLRKLFQDIEVIRIEKRKDDADKKRK
jgi:hypothetical protein